MVTWQLTMDSNDPARMARFWAPQLGYVPQPPPDGFDSWLAYYQSVGLPTTSATDRFVNNSQPAVDQLPSPCNNRRHVRARSGRQNERHGHHVAGERPALARRPPRRPHPGALAADHLDQLEALERIKAAAAAAQVAVTATFADAADNEPVPVSGRRTPPRAMSIGAEVALATLASPHAGEQRVLLSRRLRDDLPLTLAALARVELTEDRAFAVAREVAHLTPEQRLRVDDDLAPRLAGLGDVRLRQTVRRSCLTIAAEAETRRYLRARADRRVTSRRLDDGTGQLTATLPLEVLTSVRAALDAAAATARAEGDTRTAGQVRADTLAARITGLDPATDAPPVRVNLVIGVESLLGEGTEPGLVPGEGFLPAALCTSLVRRAATRPRPACVGSSQPRGTGHSSRWSPPAGASTASWPSSSTSATAASAAPPAATPSSGTTTTSTASADGGRTEASNGQGLCERCNYVKESPGWASWVAETGPDERTRSTASPSTSGSRGRPPRPSRADRQERRTTHRSSCGSRAASPWRPRSLPPRPK